MIRFCYQRSIMAVRFVIGRAGSGKTYHCLEAVRERLQRDPVDGPRLVFLVPEQASLQMERAILQPASRPDSTVILSGAHRAEVLSFKRLAYRVLDFVGGPTRRALSEPARAMVLRHLVARRSGQLQFYRRAARHGASAGHLGGFLEKLGETISELIEEAVEPEALMGVAGPEGASIGPLTDDDPVQRAKLHDLHLIYKAYLDYLGTDRLDPSQHLQVAYECLPRCTWLEGAELWVDGFASLSGQETATLIALAKMCRHVDITVLVDPSVCATSPTPQVSAPVAGRLFSRTGQTYRDLRDRFIRAGLDVEEPLVLAARPPPRFRANDSLARLERSLFVPADSPGESGWVARAKPDPHGSGFARACPSPEVPHGQAPPHFAAPLAHATPSRDSGDGSPRCIE
ncbi:MAG: hypothetical protein WBE26_15100, partial [Phycisphaerae bacterium]